MNLSVVSSPALQYQYSQYYICGCTTQCTSEGGDKNRNSRKCHLILILLQTFDLRLNNKNTKNCRSNNLCTLLCYKPIFCLKTNSLTEFEHRQSTDIRMVKHASRIRVLHFAQSKQVHILVQLWVLRLECTVSNQLKETVAYYEVLLREMEGNFPLFHFPAALRFSVTLVLHF